MKRPLLIALVPLLLLGGCGRGEHEGQVAVSVVGRAERLRDPATATPREAEAALLGAVAQGLVRLDAAGQVEPGLAIRWAISDDGLYYTFRLDHERADADRVVARLRRLVRRNLDLAPGSGLDAVREIVAVTPEVIEIRLSAPRPDLLAQLAAPGFALLEGTEGTGPLLIEGESRRPTILRPPAIERDSEDDAEKAYARRRIFLRGERAAKAVARFANGEAALVTGGDFTNMLFPRLANIPPRQLQVDPALGLFGFRVGRASAAVMAPEIRQELAMTLDRDAIGAALNAPGWRSSNQLLPPGLADVAEPSRPFWVQAFANVRGATTRAAAGRIATAQRIVAQWRAQHGDGRPVRLVLALPEGPGADLLFAAVRRQWRAIGIGVERAGPREAADLRLIDEVAPTDQADWYLAHFLCNQGRPCSEEADKAFALARAATDPAVRAHMLAEAEQRITALAPFIPIAQPLRWSLAAPDLPGFQLNARAVHPLAPLIGNQKGR